MLTSIHTWLGFEFIEMRCEAERGDNAPAQAKDVFDQCRRQLAELGLGLENAVRSRIWAADRPTWEVASNARFAALSGKAVAASSSYISPRHFFAKSAKVGLDLYAVRPRPGVEKKVIDFNPKRETPPICYVTLGSLLVVSGMTVVLPTLEEQAEEILPRIGRYLGEAGSGWPQVAHVACHLHRSQSPDEMRRLFRKAVPTWPPRFEIVQVDGYSMDGKLVEIEVTAERRASAPRHGRVGISR